MKQSPADVLAKIRAALAPDFRLVALEAPDAPLFLALALPATETTTGLKPRLPAGRGMSMHQAMLAAGAEALELRASLAQSHLRDLRGMAQDGGQVRVPAVDLLSGETVTIPAQDVFLDCAAVLAEPVLRDATSTGCAVGPDRDSAMAAALWECVERDALALWWHGRRTGAAVALDIIDALQPRLYWWLHERSRRTRLIDITTDIGLPVVVAAASDADGRMVAVGAAARPALKNAALAAVTEMVQTEVGLDQAIAAGDAEALEWLAHASMTRQPQFQPGPARTRPDLPMPDLLQRLRALGHQALAIELTLAGDPLPTIRVLVPGLCAMQGDIAGSRFARLCPDIVDPSLPEPY